jgi:predicted metal-dependent enzyme (double-stranded beta helix superfamily)
MDDKLEAFARKAHDLLTADPGPAGREQVRAELEKVLIDDAFLARHFGPENDSPRKLLYEDADLGFCILAHVFQGARGSHPHDHGPSWAIYGQAQGTTEMTDWEVVEAPKGDRPGKVKPARTYPLEPGHAHLYNEGDVHSPRRVDATRLIRIEGKNMEGLPRSTYEPL